VRTEAVVFFAVFALFSLIAFGIGCLAGTYPGILTVLLLGTAGYFAFWLIFLGHYAVNEGGFDQRTSVIFRLPLFSLIIGVVVAVIVGQM
jgi:hypothetical protein